MLQFQPVNNKGLFNSLRPCRGVQPCAPTREIPNLTPKSPLHSVERGLETRLFSPSLRSGEGGGG
jgi:hypothetical protein